VDGQGQGDLARIYTPGTLRQMASAGLSPLTYRLRTELGVEAWHWNPRGAFSDPAHHRGYWTSSSRGGPIEVSHGYRLPRRGDTIDQATDTGYSRLDDGDTRSFWKSNPYLDPHFTGEPEARHPQWVLIDLRRAQPVDGLRIDWGLPYARALRVQHWIGPSAIALAGHPPGRWQEFPLASFRSAGGSQLLRLSPRPVAVRFVRVLLYSSSHTTAPRGARDIRDRLGYAVRELSLGRIEHGRLRDLLRHRRSARQTVTMASSTDPWHRATDLDPNTEQPGFDRLRRSGLLGGQPLLVPVALLYGTPADAVAELRYLRSRRIPVARVEMGEEPDGQLASPEDYTSLYLQFARALHRFAPDLALGGPGFQTAIPDWMAWPDARGNRSWTSRFVGALRAHGALSQLSFFSFEWYPFDNTCRATAPQLARASGTLSAIIARQRQDGLPAGLPLLITEYGYSAFAGQAEVDRAGGLLNADAVGTFFAAGGSVAYLYGYEPSELIRELSQCPTWGNLAILQSDPKRRITHRLATYWAARMLSQDWLIPGDGLHTILPTRVGPTAGGAPVRAYAVRRPDGSVAVMALNLDPSRRVPVRLALGDRATAPGPLELDQFSAAQYVWHPNGDRGYPSPDTAPARRLAPAGASITLPPYSLTVIRTRPLR